MNESLVKSRRVLKGFSVETKIKIQKVEIELPSKAEDLGESKSIQIFHNDFSVNFLIIEIV